jgi:hypothetical protein
MVYLMRLLIRGGSIAAGHGVTRGYADILEDVLLSKNIEVINRSRYRETSFDAISTFNEDIDFFRPDMLLLHFGVDDAFQYVYRSEFQEIIVQLIRLARLRFNPVILLATSHTFDNPHDMDAVNIFYTSLRIVATDLDCRLIPAHSYWASYLKEHNLCNNDLVQADPRYPNERGHAIIAEAMMRWLHNNTDKKLN